MKSPTHRFARPDVLPLLLSCCALLLAVSPSARAARAAEAEPPPNFVVVFLDDSGWADFQPFGDPPYKTPNVDRLARDGCRFNNFYVPQAVCSASRSALMTGCYPGRTKVFGALPPRANPRKPSGASAASSLPSSGVSFTRSSTPRTIGGFTTPCSAR